MSKRRRKNSSPNLPMETLERARLQAQQAREEAGLDTDVDDEEEDVDDEAPVAQASRPTAAASSLESRQRRDERDQRRRSRRTSSASAPGRPSEPMQFSKRKSGPDAGYVANMLAHPTQIVTEAQLHEEYGYVITDLRSMFILAAALLVVLIALSFIL